MGEAVTLTAWEVARTDAGVATVPTDLPGTLEWLPATMPGTVAGALRANGRWHDGSTVDFDADDWWFRTSFEAAPGRPVTVRFGGLATLAEVWINGAKVLDSDSMFVAHEVAVAEPVSRNTIEVRCRSLRRHLSIRRPRGRWKTRLVEMQQLRWTRTSLLGRMPGWTPAAAPVGPWRPVTVHTGPVVTVGSLTASLTGTDGTVRISASVTHAPVRAALAVGDHEVEIETRRDGDRWLVHGELTVPGARLWMPSTHGEPARYAARLVLGFGGDGEMTTDLGDVGFRSIAARTDGDAFALSCNGVEIFCRGACWVPLDVVRLWSDAGSVREAVAQVAAAGLNIIRVTGTTVYEQRAFYDACDELGVMVWQDLMFANLDYPIDDPGFAALVDAELRQVVGRLARHPSVAVVCGGSEVEQQASMMGVERERVANEIGRAWLPAALSQAGAEVVPVPCSPSGGTFPFTPRTSVSHYYGVGAYLRPLDDARRSGIRFTSECLAFANVPCHQSVEEFLADGERPGHAPRWKQRVPRDRGAGWDFEDVRDHYVKQFFGVDPLAARYAEPERYLDLGRAAVAIAIESSVGEWRRPGSSCRGAIVYMLRDLWQGAGWGVVDVAGRPKSGFHALARASSPVAVLITDEGLNGLDAHVLNDRPESFSGTLAVRLFGPDGTVIARAQTDVGIPAHGGTTVHADSLFDAFRDISYAYRFGPLAYDVVAATLTDAAGAVISETFHLPAGHARPRLHDIGLTAEARHCGDTLEVHLSTSLFAQFVSIDVADRTPDADWFHLAPGDEKVVRCRRSGSSPAGGGLVRALNCLASAPIIGGSER